MKKLILSITLISLFISSCAPEEEKTETKEATLPSVEIKKIKPVDFQNYIEVQGSVEADKNVIITAETPGLIKRILVQEGQYVSAGQTLVILDADIIAKNIEEVEKSLELARYMYEKQENLFKQNIGSELQLTQAKNNKERLEQSLETLKTQRSKSVISAPFSGYVDEIFPKEGEMAAPQVPVMRLLDLKKVHVIADVMESYLKTVVIGKSVDVFIRALDTTLYDHKISRVGKFITASNRTFKVQVDIENHKDLILPNLVCVLRIKNEILNGVLTVPNESLLQSSSGSNYVYVIRKGEKNNYAHKIEVKPGPSDEKWTVILDNSGAKEQLKAGDEVITVGSRGVKEGMEVKVN